MHLAARISIPFPKPKATALLLLFFAGFLFVGGALGQEVQSSLPQLSIDYWLSHYEQVTTGKNFDVAQAVFDEITRVADNPTNAVYALYIFADLPLMQVFALGDGSIVLPLRTIKLCLADKKAGRARLAFILGHEVGHLVRRDYWMLDHIRKCLINSNQQGIKPDLERLKETVEWDFNDKIRQAIETEADKSGILYASLAGYDVDSIFAFIPEYYRAAGIDIHGDVSSNSIQARLGAMKERLGVAVKYIYLFDFGVRLYAIGEYDAAIECFSKFLTQYPSREVFNNLGLCYYQKALALFAMWNPKAVQTNPNFVFKMTPQVDPISRLRAAPQKKHIAHYEREMKKALNRGIENLEKAKKSDPGYAATYNNLGCAYLLKQEIEFAIGNLKKAIELKPFYKEAQNNLGVCYAASGDSVNAMKSFLAASRISHSYGDPVFNLGQLLCMAHRRDKAVSYFERYLKLDRLSHYAHKAQMCLNIPKPFVQPPQCLETILGQPLQKVTPVAHEALTPFVTRSAKIWISEDKRQHVQYFKYKSTREQRGISIVMATGKFKGSTGRGIRCGDPDYLVALKYPYLHRIVSSTRGVFWIYQDLGLAFEIREGKTRGWFLFDLY